MLAKCEISSLVASLPLDRKIVGHSIYSQMENNTNGGEFHKDEIIDSVGSTTAVNVMTNL
jgi:hypothetical protein